MERSWTVWGTCVDGSGRLLGKLILLRCRLLPHPSAENFPLRSVCGGHIVAHSGGAPAPPGGRRRGTCLNLQLGRARAGGPAYWGLSRSLPWRRLPRGRQWRRLRTKPVRTVRTTPTRSCWSACGFRVSAGTRPRFRRSPTLTTATASPASTATTTRSTTWSRSSRPPATTRTFRRSTTSPTRSSALRARADGTQTRSRTSWASTSARSRRPTPAT